MVRLTRLSDIENRLPRVVAKGLTEHPFALLGARNTTTSYGARLLVTVAFVSTLPDDAPEVSNDGGPIPNRYVALLTQSESRDRLVAHFAEGGGPIGPVILQSAQTKGGNRFYELVDWEGEVNPALMAAAGLGEDDTPPFDDSLTDAF
jgi:hypothetical protein